MKKLLFPLAVAVGLFAPRADAFCGFYVAPNDAPLYADATMVALMREGTRTVLSMSNNYKGPAADFAMVVPVPVVLHKENVKTLPHDTFKHLEELSAPRLVEYWEQDPCTPDYAKDEGVAYAPAPPMAASAAAGGGGYGVKIEAKFTVGEYDIVVLSAAQSDGLEAWLHDNGYKIPKGASTALAPYVKEQMKFFVAKVDIKKVQMDKQGVAVLSPLRFHYESQDFRLPVRLGLLNSPSKQDIIVFILGKGKRYETANYTNAFIPTNLDVADETRNAFGPFYATLFDATIGKAGGRAVVTEYAWESSSCDPCPTPPLDDNDVATLGGDVLFGMGPPPPPPQPMGGPGGPMPAPKPPPMMPGGGGYYGGGNGMVLTRLHARYDAQTLTEDLVFKAADAVVGGREFVIGDHGELEKGAKADPGGQNNFQGRYAIRHQWTGPITCSKPKRGVWGGPPAGVNGSTGPVPATNLAAAPRGAIKLAAYVRKGLDDPDSWDRAAMEQAVGPGGLPPRRACGCELPGRGTTWGLAGLGTLAVATLIAMRRKGRS
ncbi:MAG: DUF2330 domain-containing protein [Polyangiales bacterium]